MLGAVTTHTKPQTLAYSESSVNGPGGTALLGAPLPSSESRSGPFHYEETPCPRISRYLILSPKDSKGENLKDYTESFMARLDGSQSSFYPHFTGQNSVLWSHLNTRGGRKKSSAVCSRWREK